MRQKLDDFEVDCISKLPEDQIRILTLIQSMRSATPEELEQKFGEPYTVQDLAIYLKVLEMENLLSRVSENPLTYRLTNLGLVAIGRLPELARSVFLTVSQDRCFFFYTGSGPDKSTSVSACSLSDFREKVERVDVKSLEFHVPRMDVEKWIRDVLGDRELADEVERLRNLGLKGEALRHRLLEMLDSRIKTLTSTV